MVSLWAKGVMWKQKEVVDLIDAERVRLCVRDISEAG